MEQEEIVSEEQPIEIEHPRGVSHHLIYSVLPFVVIIASLFIGKGIVDYLSAKSAVPAEIAPTPTQAPDEGKAIPTFPMPTKVKTPTPSVRPTDPVISNSQKRYTHAGAGISFVYPKEWEVNEEMYKDPAVELYVGFKNPSENKKVLEVMKKPIEGRWFNVERHKESISVDGVQGTLLVTAQCSKDDDADGSSCTDSAYGVAWVEVKYNDAYWYLYRGLFSKKDEMAAEIQKMKDFLSTVKFL